MAEKNNYDDTFDISTFNLVHQFGCSEKILTDVLRNLFQHRTPIIAAFASKEHMLNYTYNEEIMHREPNSLFILKQEDGNGRQKLLQQEH